MPQPDLTILLCVFNEIGRIEAGLQDVLQSIEHRHETVEILIIDNGSTDGTRAWLETVSHPSVRVILNPANLGKGGSIKKGIGLSRGRFVVIHDPDLEYRADDIWGLVERMRETGASMVLGSRILNSPPKYVYALNYWGVVFLTGLINLLYGCRLTDSATAMKLMDGDLARRLLLDSDGFDLDFELVARIARTGGNILECQAAYAPRTKAQGKKIRAVHDGWLALLAILKSRFIPLSKILPAAGDTVAHHDAPEPPRDQKPGTNAAD